MCRLKFGGMRGSWARPESANYELVAGAKTGTLFRLACSYGGTAGALDHNQLCALMRYADQLALAFQIKVGRGRCHLPTIGFLKRHRAARTGLLPPTMPSDPSQFRVKPAAVYWITMLCFP